METFAMLALAMMLIKMLKKNWDTIIDMSMVVVVIA